MMSRRNSARGAQSGVGLNEKSERAFILTRYTQNARSTTTYTGVMAHILLAPRARGVNIRMLAMQALIMRSYIRVG
jgi:hypothetical protein